MTPSAEQPAMQAAALPDYPAPLEATVQSVAPRVEATAVAPPEREGPPRKSIKPVRSGYAEGRCVLPSQFRPLGTSRVLTITPAEFSRIGTMQYKQTLPLNDHEVVLTFDDGPIPPYSNIILDTLELQCVKATYFMVGEMARAYPAIVRRIYNAGMTIGTHSQTHPFRFQALSMQGVERQVDGGIASVDAALGDPKAVSPFFRIPGLGRTNAIEHFLQDRGLVTWSADIDTNDWWRGTSASAVVQRAMHRLNQKGRGILLMHDIHPATALGLPMLLKQLKANGYHVVQVVAAGERPKSVPDLVASTAEKSGNWPRVLRVSTNDKDVPSSKALHHRIKKLVAGKRHRVKTANLPEKDYFSTTREWQHNQF